MENKIVIEDIVAQADLMETVGDLDGAIGVLNEAICLISNEPWLFARRGRLYKVCQEWELAISDFSVALSFKPDAPTTLFLRGTCWAALGKFENAIEDFEKCILYQPKAADAYLHLGTIHSFHGDLVRTIAAYKKAFELAPDQYPGLKDELVELVRKLKNNNDSLHGNE